MYVVILGAGRVGLGLARWLLATEHEVAVIDRDPSKCAELEEELGGITVLGDGTDAAILAKAGCNRADVFVGATGADEDNFLACQLARHHFNASRTISLVSIPDHETLFPMLGIDGTVNTVDVVVDRLKQALSGASARDWEGADE